jgi:hypothetical protein
MRCLEHVPDWETDPIEVICLPPSALLITRIPLWYALACRDKRPGLMFKHQSSASERLANGERQRELRNRQKQRSAGNA